MAPVVLAERPAVQAADWFPGKAAAVGLAREFVTRVLGKQWPGLDEVQLLVSEIACNAIGHTASGSLGGGFSVLVSLAGNTARVEVADLGGSSEPRIAGNDHGGDGIGADMLTSGRGLRIVDALAESWGHRGGRLGRVVWFEVTAKPGD